MPRKIVVTESDDKNLPVGYSWSLNGITRGYSVRYSGGDMVTSIVDFDTLTEARRYARSIVRSGKAWAEVYRWCESGVSIKKVFIASYEVKI